MKSILKIALSVLLLAPAFARAQTPDQHVTNGTNSLALQTMTGLANGHSSFLSAVAADSNHERANLMLATTRLLTLVSTSPGTEFLTRLGFPVGGRNIYGWNSSLPEDGNGYVAPAGVNLNEIPDHFRTSVLAQVQAALANLAKVQSAGFTMTLTENVTTFSEVTLDKGDVLVIRAFLHFLEYYIYTGKSWNLSALLTDLRTMDQNDTLNFENLLTTYPQLLTFATTADLTAARTAFQNLVTVYNEASNFIRLTRVSQDGRLFMYDVEQDEFEGNFRKVLADLNTSLSGNPTVLQTDGSITVNASKHFDGSTALRAMLPQFKGERFVVGTFPDVTFGGLVGGLTAEGVDHSVAEMIHPTIPFGAATLTGGNRLQTSFTVLTEQLYDFYATTNFSQWFLLTNIFANSRNVTLSLDTSLVNQGFLRLNGFEPNQPAHFALPKISALTVALDTSGQLSDAVDNGMLLWTTGVAAPWSRQTAQSNDGTDAAQSAAIGHGGQSELQTVVSGPGFISFQWKVSSESFWDPLEFYVDGRLQSNISGEIGWHSRSFSIPSGLHTLRWRYIKNGSNSSGQDRGWVDQVFYTKF